MVEIEEESQKVEDFIKKYNYKACISSIPNRLIMLPSILAYQPLNFLVVISVQINNLNYQSIDKKIDEFSEMIKILIF